MSRPRVALARIIRVCADLDRTERFYRALGFETLRRQELSPAWLRLLEVEDRAGACLAMAIGDQRMDFVRFDAPGAPYPPDSSATDLWFQHVALVVRDMGSAVAGLRSLPSTPITRDGPQRLPISAGGVTAYKFRDPDGHPLEFLAFPEGVGDPRWQQRSAGLVLGYDHSAVAVRDPSASQAYYGEQLGLTIGDPTVNHGPAQEALDAVDGVVVDVLPLHPAVKTPHVELLGYRVGPRRTAHTGPADRAATRLVFRALPASGPGTIRDHAPGGLEAGGHALRDPDGHRLLLFPDL